MLQPQVTGRFGHILRLISYPPVCYCCFENSYELVYFVTCREQHDTTSCNSLLAVQLPYEPVCPPVGWWVALSVVGSVYQNFLQGRVVTLPGYYRSTCYVTFMERHDKISCKPPWISLNSVSYSKRSVLIFAASLWHIGYPFPHSLTGTPIDETFWLTH